MTPAQWKEVGKALRGVLDGAGVSVAQFARAAGFSASTARRRLSGGRVYFCDLATVARLTGQPVAALVDQVERTLSAAPATREVAS